MTINVRSIPTYVLYQSPPVLATRAIPVYVLYEPRKALPKGVTGFDGLMAMILSLTTHPFPEGSLGLAQAEESTEHDCNSKVLASALDGSFLSGQMYFFYNRTPLDAELSSYAPSIDLTGISRTRELIPQINALTGLAMVDEDIVDTPVVGMVAVIEAAASSYFFIPGSKTVVGSVPDLAVTMTNKDFNGFTPT